MRVALLAIATCTAIAGVFGFYSISSSDKAKGDFSKRYLILAKRDPDRLMNTIGTALAPCLPGPARSLVSDAKVSDLAIKTLFKGGILIAEGRSAEQSAAEFIPWLAKQAEPLSSKQKEAYLKLLKNGLNSRETILCVHSSVKTSFTRGIGARALTWEIKV